MSELISKSGAMVLKVQKLLKGHTLTGLSNGEIAKALDISPANACRYLNTLISEGLATKLTNDRFALSIGMLQIAQATSNELIQANDRIDEIRQRIAIG